VKDFSIWAGQPAEKRYAQYPRRYLNEYHVGGRRKEVASKGACATLASARSNAARACDQGFCSVVRIFDRKTGQYVFTYTAHAEHGVVRHVGYAK